MAFIPSHNEQSGLLYSTSLISSSCARRLPSDAFASVLRLSSLPFRPWHVRYDQHSHARCAIPRRCASLAFLSLVGTYLARPNRVNLIRVYRPRTSLREGVTKHHNRWTRTGAAARKAKMSKQSPDLKRCVRTKGRGRCLENGRNVEEAKGDASAHPDPRMEC